MQPESEQDNYQQPAQGEEQGEETQAEQTETVAPKAQTEASEAPIDQPEGTLEADTGQDISSVDLQPDHHEGHEQMVVNWEASEYIFREKDFLWFLALFVITLGLLALSIFLLKSWTFAVLIVVMALALTIYSRRPPRVLQYVLGPEGLQISQKLHAFQEFRAFGVVQDGPMYSIMLVPTKRFAPMMMVYFAEADGEKIVDIFGHHLPMEPLKLDFVDTLMRKLRL